MIKKILLTTLFSVQILLAQPITITYDYDSLDRMKTVSYSTGGAVAYTFDDAGNIVKVENGDAPGAELTLDPVSLSFGNQAAGSTSAPQTIRVENTGSIEIAGVSISEQSIDFRQNNT